jgi:CHASE3 domain sensor protein
MGLAILLGISAISIGLEVKSRSDAAWVDHTLGVLQKISDMRLLLRRAESSARGFGLTDDPNFAREFRESSDRIKPALDDLIETTSDNPAQTQLLESMRPLIGRRLAVSAELVRLQMAGESAGAAAPNARAEGRAAMEQIGVEFDKLAAAEDKLLTLRTANSRLTGIILLVSALPARC